MNTRLRAREGEYDMIHMIQNAKDQAFRQRKSAGAGDLLGKSAEIRPKPPPKGRKNFTFPWG